MELNFDISKEDHEADHVWTKQKILSEVGQEEIFEHYLRTPVTYRGLFRSPLREDENPTCTFKWVSGVLLFRDWSEDKAKDCFQVVKEALNCDFYTALQHIARDFKLTSKKPRDGKEGIDHNDYSLESHKKNKNNEKSIIEVKLAKFTESDIEYLKSYGLNSKITSYYNVFGIYSMWLNGNLFYVRSDDKPALAYYFGEDDRGRQKWKIYFYKTRDSFRFIGNTNRINGWIQLPKKGKLVVITKSLKDVMCLAKFGIPSIAMQAETQIPYDYIIDELKDRFDNIITLLDYDKTGITASKKIKQLYGIPYLFIGKRFAEKDFSDYVKEHGIDNARKLITQTLKKFGLDPTDFKL